jgi:aspartate/glutamate racemase
VTTFGFLHTAHVHVATFTDLLASASPADDTRHRVDESLLTDARRRGAVDDDLERRITTHLRDLADQGAGPMVCTCSTIGGPAEDIGRRIGLDVRRVDRPMAEAAVAAGPRLAVVAALESTMEPTRQLLSEAADHGGHQVTIIDAPCFEAWSHFEAGRLDDYFAALAAHLRSWAPSCDVIVLAQASMAPVQDLVQLGIPVLSSPRPAVEELLRRP